MSQTKQPEYLTGTAPCPECSERAIVIVNGEHFQLVCDNCLYEVHATVSRDDVLLGFNA